MAVTPQQTIATMKRVAEILNRCGDDQRMRKEVAQRTARWVREKNGQADLDTYLSNIEKKLNINQEDKADGHNRRRRRNNV